MNILYLCTDPGIPIRGHKGAAVHVRSLVNAFAALGHHVTVLAARDDFGGESWELLENLQIQLISLPRDQYKNNPHRERAAQTVTAAIYDQARELVHQRCFDLIYERYSLWSDVGARLATETGLPVALEVNAPLRLEAARYRRLEDAEGAAEIEARCFSTADRIAVVSRPLRDYVIEQGALAERVDVICNAVDAELFHPALEGHAVREQLALEGKFVIGFVGSVKPWHDLDTLLRAMERLQNVSASQDYSLKASTQPPEYHLLLVGDIPATLRDAIAQRGLTGSTTIIEPVPHSDVPGYIAAMHVAISPHPALDDFYFSPLKLFEYLACAVPTVAANVPPIAELVTDGESALLYPPGDACALAERIARLAAEPDLRKRLGWQGARLVLEEHTWRHNAERILRLMFSRTAESPSNERRQLEGVRLPLFDDNLRRNLYRATRADLAAPMLLPYLHVAIGEDIDGIAQLRVLKYKPRRRCVIQYDLSSKGNHDRQCSVIGKVFKDERAIQQWALHRALWSNGFGADACDGISIARPLAYIPEMRMLAQERAPGIPLEDFLGSGELNERVRQSAAAIAKLHASQVMPSTEYRLEEELSEIERWAHELARARPEHSRTFMEQSARLHEWATCLPKPEWRPVHRDFYYSQVLFASQRVTLIDLDLFALSDPAIDVANFSAHLRFLAIQLCSNWNALEDAAELFVQEYARHRAVSAEFMARVSFYRASTYFRLLHVVTSRAGLQDCFGPLLRSADAELKRAK